MGRRKGSVNKVTKLPRGVSFFSDGRARPFSVQHKKLPREFFETAEQAVARKKELIHLEKTEGSAALEYDRATHAEVIRVKQVLPSGVSLDEVARFWVQHHPCGDSPMVAQAVDVFIDAKRLSGGLDESDTDSPHVHDLKIRLKPFVLSFGDQPVNEVSTSAIYDWLLSLEKSPRSLKNHRMALLNFFNFVVRKEWCSVSPMDRLSVQDMPRVRQSEKHALSVDQANRVLELIEELSSVYLPHFALRLLLGFRTSEARRFRWEWIQPEQGRVYIPAGATKTGDAWSIDDVPPRFWKIVKKPVNTGQVPSPYVRIWKGCKATAGQRSAKVGLKAMILKELDLVNWPHNATRDTFCTLHISAYRDPQRTALILKHRNSQTLWQSYLGTLVPQGEAKAFFES